MGDNIIRAPPTGPAQLGVLGHSVGAHRKTDGEGWVLPPL